MSSRIGLKKSEEDRDRWKTEAGQLEESVDNANAKLEQLKTKLEIAESGPGEANQAGD